MPGIRRGTGEVVPDLPRRRACAPSLIATSENGGEEPEARKTEYPAVNRSPFPCPPRPPCELFPT
jgi:hypothetical protein